MTSKNIWLSKTEIDALPASGPAWDHLVAAARKPIGAANLSDQDGEGNVICLAKALVAAKTGNAGYRSDTVSALRSIATGNSEQGARALALGRELCAFVVSADLIDLETIDPGLNATFKAKLRSLLTSPTVDGPKSLVECHEKRPNNWGTHAGASRIAVALYLGDTVELEKAAKVFHGWLGNRTVYAGFKYDDDLSWQVDSSSPVGINPVGAAKPGHSIDGAQPEEMRRGASFKWPPVKTGYPWEALQGAMAQAYLLHRAGFDAWNWENKALRRAAQFLYDIGWPAESDDLCLPWLLNHAYGSTFPTSESATSGKNFGWTSWTHSGSAGTVEPPPPPPPPPPPGCAEQLASANALLAATKAERDALRATLDRVAAALTG